ncbi:MAG: T9SS type A sorting domain-containing protein [Bacteroidia bacterium]|nr:T9SS type A sorting domain-containing protein [Bacteroidia bacterium]
MKNIYFSIIALLLFSSVAVSQSYQRCATTEYTNELIQNDPSTVDRMNQLEGAVQNWIRNNKDEVERNSGAVITIPVVVHVVYRTSSQNIPDSRIFSQIAVLNEDFRRTNSNASSTPAGFVGVAADTEIEFCLAVRDPFGAAHPGITRTQTSTNSFSTNNQIKYTATGGIDAWPTSQYLNIWVGPLGSQLLGYAQFPGSGSAATDGVVILHAAFGRNSPIANYNLGRTTTHEVGHYFNLRHIWGDSNCGNDQVSDTPTQQSSNFGCPFFPRVTCINGPNGDMFMNYMDYTDDACMNLFTAGQKIRMVGSINSSRAGLISSKGCDAPVVGIEPLSSYSLFELFPNPTSDKLNLNIQFTEQLDFEVDIINMLGESVANYTYKNTLGGEFEMDLITQPKGIYFARILVEDKVYSRKIIKD